MRFLSISLSLSSEAFLRFFWVEMEADNEIPSQLNSYHLDGVHKTNNIEWNKKRKLQTDHLDLPRPKHKCWVSSEQDSIFYDNLELESMHKLIGKSKTYASVLDDISEPESAKDSNSFSDDSDTAMSLNEEVKLQMDCAETNLYKRPSNSFINWDGYNVKTSSREEDTFIESEYNAPHHDADIQGLLNLEEHFLASGSCTDHGYSEYAKDGSEHSIEKEFEDNIYTAGVNPNMYVLSSRRWNVNQEAQSSTRPPTIDQEFEQYFSMLML